MSNAPQNRIGGIPESTPSSLGHAGYSCEANNGFRTVEVTKVVVRSYARCTNHAPEIDFSGTRQRHNKFIGVHVERIVVVINHRIGTIEGKKRGRELVETDHNRYDDWTIEEVSSSGRNQVYELRENARANSAIALCIPPTHAASHPQGTRRSLGRKLRRLRTEPVVVFASTSRNRHRRLVWSVLCAQRCTAQSRISSRSASCSSARLVDTDGTGTIHGRRVIDGLRSIRIALAGERAANDVARDQLADDEPYCAELSQRLSQQSLAPWDLAALHESPAQLLVIEQEPVDAFTTIITERAEELAERFPKVCPVGRGLLELRQESAELVTAIRSRH